MHSFQPSEALKKLIANEKVAAESLRLVPHAVYYALVSIPMPWQSLKYVEVAYHRDGSISFIRDRYRISEREYKERWCYVKRCKRGHNVVPYNHTGGHVGSKSERVSTATGNVQDKAEISPMDERKAVPSTNAPETGEGEVAQYRGSPSMESNLGNGVSRDNTLAGRLQSSGLLSLSRNKVNEGLTGRTTEGPFCHGGMRTGKRHWGIGKGLRHYLYGRPLRPKQAVDIPLSNEMVTSRERRASHRKPKRPQTGPKQPSSGIVKELLKSEYFLRTELEWTEALLVLLVEGRTLLRRVLYIKKLSFLMLDNDFNLVNKRPITTKERKRSRLGMSFHFIREIFKLLKCVADLFVRYRNCEIGPDDLCASLKYVFSNVGIITGVYRYKYKVNRQIRRCKDANRSGNVWAPQWRIWCSMLRGYIPYLERCLGNLILRMGSGRLERQRPATKQRAESGVDVKIKALIKAELGANPRLMQHFNEMWRCWKADLPYTAGQGEKREAGGGDSEACIELLRKYCEMRSRQYIEGAISMKAKEKNEIRKQNGRILRLYIKNEKARQRDYLQCPFIKIDDAVRIYSSILRYLQDRRSEMAGAKLFIGFPERSEEKLLKTAIDGLKKRCQKERREFYDSLDPAEYMHKVKKNLLTKRVFGDVEVNIKSDVKYTCYYTTDAEDQLTDGFLGAYLWREAARQGLFPPYFSTHDQFETASAKRLAEHIRGRRGILHSFACTNTRKNIDLNLLGRLLKAVMEPSLAEYIVSRCNCKLIYKDMEFVNYVGLIGGLEFVSFVHAFWSLCLDVVLFKPGEILMRHFDHIFVFYEGDSCRDAFAMSVERRMPPACGFLVCTSWSGWPYVFQIGGLVAEFAASASASTIKLAETSADEDDHPFLRLCLPSETVSKFKIQVKGIVRKSTGATFLKIVNEWNRAIAGFACQYREAIRPEEIGECEQWIHKAIQKGVNSKMPARFPMVVFYAPLSLGGLGMLSTGTFILEESGQPIPSIQAHFKAWSEELSGSNIGNERIRGSAAEPLFVREYTKYLHATSRAFDVYLVGSVDNLNEFNGVNCFGGSERILRHTLFQALNVSELCDAQEMWDLPIYRRGTRAQKRGSAVLPNRRFILWWSPVLNRSNVYIGYRERIERTGVFLHGKLSNLKTLFLQIFRGRLWEQIHEGVVRAVCDLWGDFRILRDRDMQGKRRYIDGTWLRLQGEIEVADNACQPRRIYELAVNISLHWCNIDSMDLERLARERHAACEGGTPTMVIAVDLCYGCYAICGCCSDGLKSKIESALCAFLGSHRTMEIMRERLRVSLSFRFTNLELSECEMHTFGFICEVSGDGLFLFNPKNGNLYYRSVQAELDRNKAVPGAGHAPDGSIRDRTAFAVLSSASELGVERLAVGRDMSGFASRYAASFPNITVRTYGSPLHLDGLRRLFPPQAQCGFKKVQNLYFSAASASTSLFRLKLILRAAVVSLPSILALGIHYSEGWSARTAEEWAAIENSLRLICGSTTATPSHSQQPTAECLDSELFWIEDYIAQSKEVTDGGLTRRINGFRPPLAAGRQVSNGMSITSEPNLGRLVDVPPIRIPYNIIVQFCTVARTRRPVRACIELLDPFTVAFLPQYINTFVAPPKAKGIITNVLCDYKEGLQIVLGGKIVVGKWCDGTFVECPYVVVNEHGVVRSADWNFNFRIESFGREYALAEGAPLWFYDPKHRERHFRIFVEEIERLSE